MRGSTGKRPGADTTWGSYLAKQSDGLAQQAQPADGLLAGQLLIVGQALVAVERLRLRC